MQLKGLAVCKSRQQALKLCPEFKLLIDKDLRQFPYV